MKKAANIYPTFNHFLGRNEKELFLKQNSKVIWMTGLSGSGKTTLAKELEISLSKVGFLTQVLDGDNIRTGINSNLGFTEEDRKENIRRISEVTKLFIECGIICINSFITPTIELRTLALEIIGKENFIEVYIDAPLSICEQRDVKGLYAKARKGEIKNFTGIDAPFDLPINADIHVRTDLLTIPQSVQKIINHVLPFLSHSAKKSN